MYNPSSKPCLCHQPGLVHDQFAILVQQDPKPDSIKFLRVNKPALDQSGYALETIFIRKRPVSTSDRIDASRRFPKTIQG